MSLSDYEDFVFGAGLLNADDPVVAWQQVGQAQQRIADFLSQHDEIHILAPGTDLTYRVGGRKWLNANGRTNFPDGEVFSAPIEDSVNGVVRFSFPAVYAGQAVEDIRLIFQAGKVIEASAARGQDLLVTLLDQDAGARYVGEVAFGLNDQIWRFTNHLLFDEKIGGTMHLALGFTYPETGGKNQSGLHWDMICDLRQGRSMPMGSYVMRRESSPSDSKRQAVAEKCGYQFEGVARGKLSSRRASRPGDLCILARRGQ
jgi:aminopeptidase